MIVPNIRAAIASLLNRQTFGPCLVQLTLRALNKSFGANAAAKDFDRTMEDGEFISLLGPSGCGRTTVPRMLAGFEAPSSGAIHIDRTDVMALQARQRRIGTLFQCQALIPIHSIEGDAAFGLKVACLTRAGVDAGVMEMLDARSGRRRPPLRHPRPSRTGRPARPDLHQTRSATAPRRASWQNSSAR